MVTRTMIDTLGGVWSCYVKGSRNRNNLNQRERTASEQDETWRSWKEPSADYEAARAEIQEVASSERIFAQELSEY